MNWPDASKMFVENIEIEMKVFRHWFSAPVDALMEGSDPMLSTPFLH